MKHSETVHVSRLIGIIPSGIVNIAEKRDEGYVEITIENIKRRRSTGERSQNHHLNGHIQAICEETGNEFEDVKKHVKQMAINMGYPMKMKGGDVVLDMWGSPIGISEAESTVEQCAMLIECVHMLAAELGIILVED